MFPGRPGLSCSREPTHNSETQFPGFRFLGSGVVQHLEQSKVAHNDIVKAW